MQIPPKHSVTGTKAREKEFGIQVDVTGRGATYERDEFGRTINLVEAGGVGRIARPAPGPPISGRGGGYVNSFGILNRLVTFHAGGVSAGRDREND